MNLDADEFPSLAGFTQQTISSNAYQHSLPCSEQTFPLLTDDSGLYTCSSNSSLQLDSETDSSLQISKTESPKYGRLQSVLQDMRKLRSELERLTKSEQWYKQELKQQKSTRLNELERIYVKERKFMQENQLLQEECVRLYEKCNELEKELAKPNPESQEHHVPYKDYKDEKANNFDLEKEKTTVLITDQQHLISVLRKQKHSLLEDLKSLTEEKDEKVLELQRILADLEFDNKLITKKYNKMSKERVSLENNLKLSDNKLSMVLREKFNLQKSILDLREELGIQQQLLKLKESEIERLQQHYTHKIQAEENLEEVHKLSVKYQEEINAKTIEIISLKERLQEMQDEMEDMQDLQQQSELQQQEIEQLNFSIEAYSFELQELKSSEEHKSKQLDELHAAMEQLIEDKELVHKAAVEQQNDYLRLKQTLKVTQDQYEQVQDLYKKTQFELEILEIEQGKLKLQNEQDRQEIECLRNKLREYLQQTKDLSQKIQNLENELAGVLKENLQLKQDAEQLNKFLKNIEESCEAKTQQKLVLFKPSGATAEPKHNDTSTGVLSNATCFSKPVMPDDQQHFLDLQQQCERLQANLDLIKNNQDFLADHQVFYALNDFIENVKQDDKQLIEECSSEKCPDFKNLTLQCDKLQENVNRLNEYLKSKHFLLSHIERVQESNTNMDQLVIENEILKKNLLATEAEVLTLQLKQDINDRSEKQAQLKECLDKQISKVADLQEKLVKNDGKLYQLERKLQTIEEVNRNVENLQLENSKLKEQLKQEQLSKTEFHRKLLQETENLTKLRQSLEELQTQKQKQKPAKDQAVQCILIENSAKEKCEVKELKEHVVQLQQQLQNILKQEAHKKDERLQLLHQMMNLQNNKLQNLQQNQKDWEDILTALNKAQSLEEEARKELELKRMELEELNAVFADQNEEFRKLEEFTGLLELKRQKEKEKLKLLHQQEIDVMKQHLKDCQQEIEKQKLINQQLEKRGEIYEADIKADQATDLMLYKNEIRALKTKINKITEEKEDLWANCQHLEGQIKELNANKREAFIMPDNSLARISYSPPNKVVEDMEVLKQNISEDHVRILTKVLESEYQRKMLRYDEHIHSLLSNLKSLKKSLKANEEKTLLLSAEQLKTKEQLKDLQKTKNNLEEMSLKYEQSENTIKELRQSLASEHKKFELSDSAKCSQNNGAAYEVSNLIDDYKKLIQQSAVATKRPSTNAILDLIQRSNQYVPNLQKLESNVEALRFELEAFLTYSHKMPAASLIRTSSLSMPPSLMDEIRAATEGF